MNFHLDIIQDKIELFEATSISSLEKQIQTQIDINKAILLEVHSVSHQMHVEEGHRFYSAVVHFKHKK